MQTAGTLVGTAASIPAQARELEQLGADIAVTIELGHDPLLQLALAATTTEKIKLMSGISVVFGRTPMTIAQTAHDINALSKGRMILGVGSQIKPHIEKRYSMPWSQPAKRMREYVQALKAIWACWYEGEPLDFRGEFYTHTLMTPMFTPEDKKFGAPPVMVAAVGPVMTEAAAEVADGVLIHSFMSEQFLRTVSLPAMEAGLAKSGRSRDQIQVFGQPMIVTGATEEEFEKVKDAVRKQLAFYGSTPAYRGILEAIDRGPLQGELNALSKEGKWDTMAERIDDELLDQLALVGEPAEIAQKLERRYGDIFDVCSASVFAASGYGGSTFRPELAQAIGAVSR